MKEITSINGFTAIVDDEDYETLSKSSWYYNGAYLCEFKNHGFGKLMHRILLNPPRELYVDHKNLNKLDNRKSNLRLATSSQNAANKLKRTGTVYSSEYKGLYVTRTGNFCVRVSFENVVYHIGTFNNEIAAANAYNHYAKIYHKEFANLNQGIPYMAQEEWESMKNETSSEYYGVHWHKREGKWRVSCKLPGNKTVVFGWFYNEIAAANYYNYKIKENELPNKKNWLLPCDVMTLEDCEKLKLKPNYTSQYRGVFFNNKVKKWSGFVYINETKKYYLGKFDSEIEAAEAYNKKAIELNIKNLERRLNKIEK